MTKLKLLEMTDFTTLQHFEIPPPIRELQSTNTTLKGQNKFFRNILIGIAVGVVIVVAINLYNRNEEENEKARKRK